MSILDHVPKELGKLSVEMIDPQLGDPVVGLLEEQYNSLIHHVKNSGLDDKKIVSSKTGKLILSEIDDIIFDRFGIRTRHLSGDEGYSVLLQTPGDNNTMGASGTKTLEEMQQLATSFGSKDEGKLTDLYDDIGVATATYEKSLVSLEKQLKTSRIVIDLKKAYVKNLPKEYKVLVMISPNMLVKDMNVSAIELVSILLHEIGHIFTHMEYITRTVVSTKVLTDSLHDSINSKDHTGSKTIELAYASLDGNVGDLEGKSTEAKVLTVVDRYARETQYLDPSDSNVATDSEQLADQFAGRFGVGLHLSTVLKRFADRDIVISRIYNISIVIQSVIVGALYAIVFGLGAIGGLVVATMTLIVATVVHILVGTVFSILFIGLAIGKTYDDPQQRLRRIRNESVRQLRLGFVDKKNVKTQLVQIDSISKLIETLPTDGSISAAIGNYVATLIGVAGSSTTTTLARLTENLQENTLVVSHNKLRNIG